MASYDNLMTEQPWPFRPVFSDAWISDIFTKETETITNALQYSIASTSSNGDVFSSEIVESLIAKPDIKSAQTPTASGGSENEVSVSKQRRSVPPSGRVTKRKSRPSKRGSTTTFITADPENFRQMVQQVTGVKFGGLNGQLPVAPPLLKPEPQRFGNLLQPGGGLPTLDTSAFLLENSASPLVSQPQTAASDGVAQHYFDSYSFPTLESWKAV
ncbi:hypothetical protein CDL12_06190 [Handroanthus impetiginosus]|uniref:VQ domain-containing protein n=1 Tax=Handroanthus impetiginosus TaxID=429701 RepID=A0A2G9HUC4_9LAMI|nr:hypothetical protein CDL12_06190 [Handroanthus impetiginosus]